ncbi:MAG TPA: cytochrome c-type biogenesis CcmF C-terminal domain-containing protein [Gemmatimonadaceae bacterium]|nr:cytochrome c-type biogenesis CcmF C-terminal domain-containing protein [Gemmatimonadaceae bacterium]
MIELGSLSIWLALLLALWALVAGAGGVVRQRDDLAESASRALVAAGFFVTLAFAGLLDALLGADLSVRYAARHVTQILPGAWRIAALWAGVEGRVLTWAMFTVIVAGALAVTVRRRGAAGRGLVSTLMAAALVIAVSLAAIGANAFVRLTVAPIEGAGLLPMLRDPGFLVAPPLLLLGCALTLPMGAIAGAAMVARRLTRDDIRALRAWAQVAFTVLTLGLAAWLWWNARLSGDRLGWMADALTVPVFAPWLLLVIALHALARADSARDHVSGVAKLALVLAAAVPLLTLLVPIAPLSPVAEQATRFAGWTQLIAWLAVSLCIVVLAFAVARIHLDPPSAESRVAASMPADFRRVAAPLAHAGFVIVLVAIAGSLFRSDQELVLRVGEPASVRDPYGLHWEFVAQGISRVEAADGGVLALGVEVKQGSGAPALVSSEARAWVDARGMPIGEPYVATGVHGSALEQVRVRLVEVIDEGRSRVQVNFVPLAWLTWLGAACMVGAGALAMWPGARDRVREHEVSTLAPDDAP